MEEKKRTRIIKNAIRCKHCGDVIESKTVHDFVTCSCGACSVDGGHDYLRRCYISSPDLDYDDLSEVETNQERNPPKSCFFGGFSFF